MASTTLLSDDKRIITPLGVICGLHLDKPIARRGSKVALYSIAVAYDAGRVATLCSAMRATLIGQLGRVGRRVPLPVVPCFGGGGIVLFNASSLRFCDSSGCELDGYVPLRAGMSACIGARLDVISPTLGAMPVASVIQVVSHPSMPHSNRLMPAVSAGAAQDAALANVGWRG